MSRLLARLLAGAAALALIGTPLTFAGAQSPPPIPPCPGDQVSKFDFMVGQWQGILYDLKDGDSTRANVVAHTTNAKILGGCALEERWHFEENGATEVDAVLLRGYDTQTRSWSYGLVTSRNESVRFEGRLDGDVWYFFHEIVDNGKAIGLRISWIPTPAGYTEQIARSMDHMKTWTPTRHINFTRLPSPH
jgi:hypothetical protein